MSLRLCIAATLAVLALHAESTGSGFIVSKDGHVITNFHVVEGCREIRVRTGETITRASVIAVDPVNDLAVAKSQELVGKTALALRRTGGRLAEPVLVMGYPLSGITASSVQATTGNISALAGLGDDTRVLQFTAPVQPGNSGGPLLDATGGVVGIVTYRLSSAWSMKNIKELPQNVNFAFKAAVISTFLSSNGVTHEIADLPTDVSALTDVADRARPMVLAISCQGERTLAGNRPERSVPGQVIVVAGHGKQSIATLAVSQLGDILTASRLPVVLEFQPNLQIRDIQKRHLDSGSVSVLYMKVKVSPWNWKDRLVVELHDSSGKLRWVEQSSSASYISDSDQVSKLVANIAERVLRRLSSSL